MSAETEQIQQDFWTFSYARRNGVLLDSLSEASAQVICRQAVKPIVIAELSRHLGKRLQFVTVADSEFEQRLQDRYQDNSSRAMQMMEGMDEEADLNAIAKSLSEPEDLLDSADDAPIIRLINALLTEAIKENASDIHIEPFENRLSVRFRIDGVLREVLQPPKVLTALIISRVKVMSRLDIAEKRLPQDGRISIKLAGRAVDIRVSTLPCGHGERAVLRILDKQAGRLDLLHLGMDSVSLDKLRSLITRPHGILLVTGPTGSGKTTTLYAAMGQINDHKRNILTVEDPIEYYLDGVGQTQVNNKVEMSFARTLRAILRQDPDVVMVGEIRDAETARIAVQASLTGHLVFSTLHTNSAVGAIARLRDMGIEPFLLASSIIGVLAQRLVRLLCPHCKKTHQLSDADRDLMGIADAAAVEIYQPTGCEKCNGTGYRGRTGIYELIEVDEQLRCLIHDNASEQELEAYAVSKAQNIRKDGFRRVMAGETSIEEVVRVTEAD